MKRDLMTLPKIWAVAIDLFAGAGGFTVAAIAAGCKVVWAANHKQNTVDTHAANHPQTVHVCQDLHQADWADVPAHDLLLAAPCCQGHSPARGKAANNPHHDSSRSTAWAVVSAAEYHRPKMIVVENVPAFLKWSLYPAWRTAMEALGYCLSPHIVDAADHNVPQHRERLFIVMVRAKHPLLLTFEKQPHVPASSFIDFDADKWQSIERPGRAAATLRRVSAGRATFGDRFLMPYYGGGSGLTGRSLGRPIGTITTRDRWAVVDGDRMRMISIPEARAAMGFPSTYLLPEHSKLAMHMLGNAVCPLVGEAVINALKAAA